MSDDHFSNNPSEESEDAPSEQEMLSFKPVSRRVTVDSHLRRYEELEEYLDERLEHFTKNGVMATNTILHIRKALQRMKKEVPKVNKYRPPRPRKEDQKGGFSIQYHISEEMCDFLNVPHDTKLSRNEVRNALCAYIRLKPMETRPKMTRWQHLNVDGERNLQDPEDGRNIIPDAKLSKLLRYDKYVKDVKSGEIIVDRKDPASGKVRRVKQTDSKMHYSTLSILIGRHIIK